MKKQLPCTLPFLGLALASLAYSVEAQQGNATLKLEEIIVTAERRETSLQDTPISVAAFGAAELDKLGVNDLSDLQHNVPNMTFRQFPNSQSSLRAYIRGVGNNDVQVTLDPAVGVYLDGIYIGRSSGLAAEVASLQRIEVLRGPQGSLYGRNTTGGAINLITERPSGVYGQKHTVSAGNRDYLRYQGEIDLPKMGDFSSKVGLLASTQDGLVENKGSGPNFGDYDNLGARIAVNWAPTEQFEVDYSWDYTNNEFGVLYYQTVAAPFTGFGFVPHSRDRQEEVTPAAPFFESTLDISGHSLTMTWSISEALTIKSLTGYRELEENLYQDYGANSAAPRLFANIPFDTDHEQVSQEFQAIGTLMEGQIDYIGGLYYFTEEGKEFTTDYVFNMLLQTRMTEAENEARAVYGRVTWSPQHFEQRLHLTVGLRYSEDEREVFTNRSQALDTVTFAIGADDEWSNTSPDLTVSYDINLDTNVYLKYVESYKTGGFNGRGTRPAAVITPVDEETVEMVEAGIKSQFLDDRIRVNAAVFRSDYTDIQLSFAELADPATVINFNAGEAEIKGFEAELDAIITSGLSGSLEYGYLDTEVTEVIDPNTGQDISDTNRFELPGAPKKSVSASLEYVFPPLAVGELSVYVNYTYRDDMEFVARPRTGFNLPAYKLWNARITLSDISVGGPGKLRVSLWGKNLNDEEFLIDGIEAFPWSPLVAAFGDERRFGLDATYEF